MSLLLIYLLTEENMIEHLKHDRQYDTTNPNSRITTRSVKDLENKQNKLFQFQESCVFFFLRLHILRKTQNYLSKGNLTDRSCCNASKCLNPKPLHTNPGHMNPLTLHWKNQLLKMTQNQTEKQNTLCIDVNCIHFIPSSIIMTTFKVLTKQTAGPTLGSTVTKAQVHSTNRSRHYDYLCGFGASYLISAVTLHHLQNEDNDAYLTKGYFPDEIHTKPLADWLPLIKLHNHIMVNKAYSVHYTASSPISAHRVARLQTTPNSPSPSARNKQCSFRFPFPFFHMPFSAWQTSLIIVLEVSILPQPQEAPSISIM